MSITNNPFVSTRLNDTNIRVLRSTSVTQRVRDDLPLAVQYVKYDEEDFFAVGFNRILKTKIQGGYSEIFDFYNIDVFERNYLDYFEMIKKVHIKNSERIMYLFKVKK